MKDKLTILVLGAIALGLIGLGLLTRAQGALVVATPGVEVQLRSGWGRLLLRSSTGPVAVPARVYRPTSLVLTCVRDGDTWQLRSAGPWGRLAHIRAERGRTTTIEAGPPLQIQPQVEIFAGQVLVGLLLVGRAGERYDNFVLKNNRRISEPQVKIVDEAGTVLASGQFQFG